MIAELHPVQRSIMSIRGKQVRVGAEFDDSAGIQNDNLIGALDRAESVRDYQRRPILHELTERFLDASLRL